MRSRANAFTVGLVREYWAQRNEACAMISAKIFIFPVSPEVAVANLNTHPIYEALSRDLVQLCRPRSLTNGRASKPINLCGAGVNAEAAGSVCTALGQSTSENAVLDESAEGHVVRECITASATSWSQRESEHALSPSETPAGSDQGGYASGKLLARLFDFHSVRQAHHKPPLRLVPGGAHRRIANCQIACLARNEFIGRLRAL